MKRKIEQLQNGIFEYETPALVMTPEELVVPIESGKVSGGSFALESADGRKIQGCVYSSIPRMRCEPAEFQGTRCQIHFQADGNGFPGGEEESGFFTICSELGEYRLPFVLRSKEAKEETEVQLPAGSLEEFVALAKEDYQKAYRCFLLTGFRNVLAGNLALEGLYDSLTASGCSYQSMEEFLTGSGKKDPIRISADRMELTVTGLAESVAEVVQLTKSGWGFQKIAVESDAEFVRPEKVLITTDEFAGSTYDLKLIFDVRRMHAGKNFARVTLLTQYQRLSLEVTALRAGSHAMDAQYRMCRRMQKKLENLYISFRLKKIPQSVWIERSCSALGNYQRAGGTDVFADLFFVQLYYADGKRQKALRILEALGGRQDRLNTPDRYGFYRYLTTFFHQETEYVDQVEEEIRALFAKNRTNWQLQWILLYLKESLQRDQTERYEAVQEQFYAGCRSRILYVEAYFILAENPFLMRHLGSFELQVLRFAAREQVLTEQMTRQMEALASHYGKYSKLLYEILVDGYESWPSAGLVQVICQLLMKGARQDEEAFGWYEKGVSRGLRITGLYEAYMESTKNRDLQQMPQIIRMYFAYDTSLDYRRRAAIYRVICERQEEDPQTWRTFRPAMEKFASDQLELGRLTEDLVVLYQKFLRKNLLTRLMAEQLSQMLFAYEVTCTSPDIRSVTVHSPRLLQEQSAVFVHGKARISIYDADSTLVLEDAQGVRYAADQLSEKRKLFDHAQMLEWCTELAPDFLGILLFVCEGCLKEHAVNRHSLPYLRKGCERKEFREEFRDGLRREVLGYYVAHPREESLQEFLQQIAYPDYVKLDKASLITLLAEEGMCSDAFSLLDMYGAEQIPLVQLVRICSRMVLDLEFAENEVLVYLCHFCFASGKYDDKLLRYLVLYYEGPISDMMQVWDAARRFELDTMLLEEKLLVMILFTRSGTEGSEPVFEAYTQKMGRRRLCRAYLNLKSYEYFVRGLPVADCVFRHLEKEYAQLQKYGHLGEQEEVCRLALLQYYAKQISLTEVQRQYVAQLLEEFGAKGMRFAFWKQFDRALLRPYQMEGKVFVEYVGNPASQVTICYRQKGSGEDYTREPVKNCFEGIFVREFTLFYGDELECYLEEDDGKQVRRTDPRPLVSMAGLTDGVTMYELLNRMAKAEITGDTEAFDRELENYALLEYLAGELFTLI